MDELTLLREFRSDGADCDELTKARAKAVLRAQFDDATPTSTARSRRRARFAAVGILLGIALGFGVGASFTPSSAAETSLLGFGFLPADGWKVVQSGTVGTTGTRDAIAANVPIDFDDETSDLPYVALRRLPTGGVVIAARLFPRGDKRIDPAFPLRTIPLRVADAVPTQLPATLSATSLVAVRVRAGAHGYNLDARVFFGSPPSPTTLGRVDEQLRRLVVAPSNVSLVVQPRVLSDVRQRMSIFGSVSSAEAGEKVTIQFKGCGLIPSQFRDAYETTTNRGGGFTVEPPPLSPGVSGVFRAVSGGSASAEVPVSHQAEVTLLIRGRGRFEAAVTGKTPFWRRYVVLQRYQRSRGTWVNVRRLVLTEQWANSGSIGAVVSTSRFRPPVPRGTRIRVVFPLSQARPCYLAGVSEVRRA